MQHLIPFRHRKQWYAVDASLVEQILGAQSWMPVPGAPPLFPGVMAWRGRATAVLDLSLLPVGEAPAESRPPDDRPPRTLIAHVNACTLGIPTDEVREALLVETLQLLPLRLSRVRFSQSEFELGQHIAVVLDLAALVDSILGSRRAEEAR
jgi:chemotaxis signal transduction protein